MSSMNGFLEVSTEKVKTICLKAIGFQYMKTTESSEPECCIERFWT